MFKRFKHSLVFQLEQILVRGPLWRFAVILGLVALVALVAGLLVHTVAPGFETGEDAVWWAFLRLTDPGYLGDDTGVAKASVSTVITILGSVLFTGALIAILVQWLDDTLERLQMGLTPVTLDAHFVVAGWNSRTPTIVEEIMVSRGRVERFLRKRGARHLRVALLVEQVDTIRREEIRLQLGEHWDARQIIVRNGSSLDLDDLERVDFVHAGAILIPATDTTAGSTLDADAHTVKTLITMGTALEGVPAEELPLVVAEIQDTRYIGMLRTLYRGPIEVIAGDEIVARLMVQNVRQPGLSHVYNEFATEVSGSQIYVREEPGLTGVSIQALTYAFPEGVLLGIVRPDQGGFRALLNAPNGLRLEEGDRIVVLAPSYSAAAPPERFGDEVQITEKPAPEHAVRGQRRVLVLGWNHRVPALLDEFAAHPQERFAIDIVSLISAKKREQRIAVEVPSTDRLTIRQLELDYALPANLESLDPAGYDNVVFLASERLKSGAESDARTILGCLLLRDLLEKEAAAPSLLVELSDPDNAPVLENRYGEVIVSPVIVSHMLARVALRRELRAVIDELFSSGGSEIFFRRITDYGLVAGEYTFAGLQRAADTRGEIAIGVRWAERRHEFEGGVQLNPARDGLLNMGGADELIVLTTDDPVVD